MTDALSNDTLHKLQKAAMAEGLLDASEPPPEHGVVSEATADAIEAWIERHVDVAEPDDASCRRFHAAQGARFAVGERVRCRHVLFAVAPGVDVASLRQRAEALLLELRASEDPLAFGRAAAALSNCPSGSDGGSLGWVTSDLCAPEFSREVFGHAEVGVLPRLVHSRHGLHVVEVLEREPGRVPAYETISSAVRQVLRQQAWVNAVRRQLDHL